VIRKQGYIRRISQLRTQRGNLPKFSALSFATLTATIGTEKPAFASLAPWLLQCNAEVDISHMICPSAPMSSNNIEARVKTPGKSIDAICKRQAIFQQTV